MLATAALCLTTLAPFGATLANAADSNDATLQFQRGQAFVGLDSGQPGTFDAVCPSGFHAVNGGFQLDGGSSTASRDLFVLASYSSTADIDPGAGVDNRNVWRVELTNSWPERVTGRVNAVCVGTTTAGGDKHQVSLSYSAWSADDVDADDDGILSQSASCSGTSIPAGVEYRVGKAALGVAVIRTSSTWNLQFEDYSNGGNFLHMRAVCLDPTTGAGTVPGSDPAAASDHTTNIVEVRPAPDTPTTTSVANAASAESNFSCPAGSVAVAGEFYAKPAATKVAVDSGVVPLGAEPRSPQWSQRFYNDSGAASSVITSAVCVAGTLNPEVVQDFAKSGFDRKGADQLKVTITCTLACGTLTGKVYRQSGANLGDQVAFGRLALGSAKTGTLKMRIKRGVDLSGARDFYLVVSNGSYSERFSVSLL